MRIYEYKTVVTCVNENAPEELVNSAKRTVDYMKGAFDFAPEQESLWLIFLNNKNIAKGRQMMTLGTQTACLADPKLIFRAALLANATAIICVHNHPSGNPAPSAPDLFLTRQLREAAKAIDIQLQDHVIIGDVNSDPMKKGYFSFRDSGLI